MKTSYKNIIQEVYEDIETIDLYTELLIIFGIVNIIIEIFRLKGGEKK